MKREAKIHIIDARGWSSWGDGYGEVGGGGFG